MMKIIDIDKWKRKVPYQNFIGYSNPVFSLSTHLDVTYLFEKSKRENTSFFSNFLYVAMKCLNSIEEFRLRIYKGNVVLYDEIKPSFIVLADCDVIVTCQSEMKDSYAAFYESSRKAIQLARKSDGKQKFNSDDYNNYFYISCIKWVDIASIINPYNLSDADNTSIPRITWGKAVNKNGRWEMMMDISAHHALIDGEPICRGFMKIQQALNNIDEYLN
jgi:chloramphenicol O-acetyltransferase type A